MEQRKRALTNAAKRQTLRATAQPETASREMQARVVGKLVSGDAPHGRTEHAGD
jgi:hypothetical protein